MKRVKKSGNMPKARSKANQNGKDNPAFGDDEVARDEVKDGFGVAHERLNVEKNGGAGQEQRQEGVQLERRVGLLSGVALIVGTMIGSGIFVSPGDVLQRSKSVGTSLIIWGGCGLLSLFGALSYCELGTLIPKSGAEYIYLLEAFRPKPTELRTLKARLKQFFGPLPAFLFGWVSILLLRPSSFAIIALSFASYVVTPILTAIGSCSVDADFEYYKSTAVKLVACVCIGLIGFINCYSVDLATKVQNFFTAAKLIAMGIIIAGGIYMMVTGDMTYLSSGFAPFDPSLPSTSFSDVATAFYSGLWAYDGWNNLNYITEELKNPNVNLPRAIMIGLPLVTVSYILVNVAYLAVLSPLEIISSPAVAVDWGALVLGPAAFLMPLAVALSTFGAANGSQFTTARLCYVASREGHMVDIMSYIHITRLTPVPAVVFNTIVPLVMVAIGDIASLIDFFSFTAWIFYGGCMLALIVLRFTRPDAPRPYKVPIGIPIIVLIISVYLVFAPIIQDPKIEYLYATLFILAGLIFYLPFIYYKVSLGCMGPVNKFLQILLLSVPTKYD